jgi:hypothetical protein
VADYVITTKDINLGNVKVVRSVKDVVTVTKSSFVVFESSDDLLEDAVSFLVGVVKRVLNTHLVYIASNPVPLIEEVIKGLGSQSLRDDSYLDDLNSYSELIDYLEKGDTSLDEDEDISSEISVLDSFVSEQVENLSPIQRSMVQDSYDKVVGTLDEMTSKDVLREQLVNFAHVSRERVVSLEQDLKLKEKEVANLAPRGGGFLAGTNNYPVYNYSGSAKVLVVKEHSPCRYLTSFLYAFAERQEKVNNIKTKLIVVSSKNYMTELRYKGAFDEANPTTIVQSRGRLMTSTKVYTTTPTAAVMDFLMQSLGYDLYVILDRTDKKEECVAGRGIKTVHAVSNLNHMRALKLEVKNTIVNDLGVQGQLGVLAMINNIGTKNDERIAKIQQGMDITVTLLENILGLQARR